MAGPAYVVTNLLSASVTFTPSSTIDTVYTLANLYDGRQNKPCRFGANSFTLLMDFGSPVALTFVGLIKHNATSAIANMSMVSGTTSAVNNGIDQAITWATKNIYQTFTGTYRYWRLWMDDPTNPDDLEMGELYMAVHTTLSQNFAYGWEQGLVDTNDEHMTEFGTKTVYEKYEIETRRFPFVNRTATLRDELKTLWQATKRNVTPLVLVPDLTANVCLFGRLVNNFGAQNVPHIYYSSGIEFAEEAPGVTLT